MWTHNHSVPEDLNHQALASDLKQLVEVTRQPLTLPRTTDSILSALTKTLNLGDDWLRIVPQGEYPEHLGMMERHLASVTFGEVSFEDKILRDVLLSGGLLFGRGGEALQVFFPEASSSTSEARLPSPTRVAPILESAEHFNRARNYAEKNTAGELLLPGFGTQTG